MNDAVTPAPSGAAPLQDAAPVAPPGFTPREDPPIANDAAPASTPEPVGAAPAEPPATPSGYTPRYAPKEGGEDKTVLSRILDALTASGKVRADNKKFAIAEGNRRRDERLSRINGTVGGMLGANYDPDGEFGLDSLEEFMRMADVARSKSLVDQLKKFRETYPEGDLLVIPTEEGDIPVARRSKSEPYARVVGLPAFAAAVGSEPVAYGTLGATLGGTVGPFTGVLGTIVGTGIGVGVQIGTERLRGYGEGEGGAPRAIQEGLTAGAVDAALRGGGSAIRAMRGVSGATTFRQRMELAEVVEAIPELGLEPLAIGQTGPKFARGIYRQVGATSQRVESQITAQEQSLLTKFRELSSDDITALSEDAVLDVVRAQHKELSELMSFPVLSRMETGDALQTALETYRKAQKTAISKLYGEAMERSAEVTFVLKDAQAVARDIQLGVRGRGKPITETVESPILDASGRAITSTKTTTPTVALAETPQGGLKAVVDDLLALDPTVTELVAKGKVFPAFEQIKTLRTRLFDLKQSDDGAVRREATKLWKALTTTMDSPISGDPGFVEAYRAASMANRLFEDTMEKSFVARVLKSDTPENIIKTMFQPGSEKAIRTMRDILPPAEFQKLQQGFVADILRAKTGQAGLSRLDTFVYRDPRALGLLVPRDQQTAVRKFLTRRAQFEASPAQAILTRQFTDAERVVQIVNSGTAGELTDAVVRGGGIDSKFADVARAGVYRHLLNEATVTSRSGIEVLDTTRLLNAIEKMKATDKLSALFRRTDWQKLELFRRYAAPISEATDVGGGMMAGSLRQRAVDAPTEIATGGLVQVATRLVRPLYANEVTAKILSRPASYSALTARPSTYNMVNNGALALFLMTQELGRESQEPAPRVRKRASETAK